MKPGLGFKFLGIKFNLKKIVTAIGGLIGGAIGGPLGAAAGAAVAQMAFNLFDGAKQGEEHLPPGMRAPEASEAIKEWAEDDFTPWFIKISKGLKSSAIKSVVLSSAYRQSVNRVLKSLESYRIYLQTKKQLVILPNWKDGLAAPGQVQAIGVLKRNEWATKEDIINIFKKAIWDAYIDVLKTHGVTAYAKTVSFTAPKSDQGNFPEPFTWDKSNSYTSELMLFTTAADGEPATRLHEESEWEPIEDTENTTGETSGGFPKSPVLIDGMKQTVGEKPTTGDPVNTNPTTTTQNPTENNQTGTPKTETENNKIFGLPKPLAYLIGGATIWKVLSN